MRHEYVGQTELVAQVLQQIDHLRLDGDIESRHCFVRDQDIGLDGKGARDAEALTLPAGELMRIPVSVIGVQARPAPAALGPGRSTAPSQGCLGAR